MSEAQDQTRREAEDRSRRCPYCHGAGMVPVFRPGFDGTRTAMARFVERGEVVERPMAMIVWAHCVCPLGEWIRGKTDRETIARIPDLRDVLAGRSRWQVQDPTRDEDGMPIGYALRSRFEMDGSLRAK